MIALGLEGSANKLGIGILKDNEILSNIRDTYITPPGTGFLPSETAKHHRDVIVSLIKRAFEKANISWKDIDCICYTKGIVCLLSIFLVFMYFSRTWNWSSFNRCRSCCKNVESFVEETTYSS